jgi:ribonuclease-3
MALDLRRQKQLQTLIRKLGLVEETGVDWPLLDLALTHPSVSAQRNYQQLEFTGDAVIRLVAAEVLMENYPQAPVGELASLRSMMVSDRTLAQWADLYGLERYLWISPSALGDKAGRVSRLADAFEAVLGALYLSTHDMRLVRPWLDEHLRAKAAEIRQDPARQNYKDALQEWTQAKHKCLPEYRVRESLPPAQEQERFEAEVWLKQDCLGKGTGPSKKMAEQTAARNAFFSFVQPQSDPQMQ